MFRHWFACARDICFLLDQHACMYCSKCTLHNPAYIHVRVHVCFCVCESENIWISLDFTFELVIMKCNCHVCARTYMYTPESLIKNAINRTTTIISIYMYNVQRTLHLTQWYLNVYFHSEEERHLQYMQCI